MTFNLARAQKHLGDMTLDGFTPHKSTLRLHQSIQVSVHQSFWHLTHAVTFCCVSLMLLMRILVNPKRREKRH